MRYFILGLFAALAVAVPIAAAAAVKPTPTYTITGAKVSGKNVKFDLRVKAASNVPGCKGTVTASHKISKKKTVSWTGKLKTTGTDCATTIKGKLPKSKFGKKVKFSIKFPGNKVIKKFSASKSLALSPPPPPPPAPAPAPTPGTGAPGIVGPQKPGLWFMLPQVPNGDSGHTFTLKADRTVSAFLHPSSMSMNCNVSDVMQVPFSWSNTNFGMGTPAGTVSSTENAGPLRNMTFTVSWSFTGAHAGTGHFSASGEFESPAGVFNTCSLSYAVDFSGGNP